VQTKAVARYVRISPRKARLVTDLIKGKDLGEAQQILDFSPKGAARVVAKVLASAAANAENNNRLSPDSLFVLRAYVDEGPTLKRFRPRAMGRATRINKRSSHITIILEEREPDRVTRRRFRRRPKPERAADASAPESLEEELENADETEAEAADAASPGDVEEELENADETEAAADAAGEGEPPEDEPGTNGETPPVDEPEGGDAGEPDTEGSEG